MKRSIKISIACIAIALLLYWAKPYNLTGVLAGMAITYMLFAWAGTIILKKALKRKLEEK